MSILHIIVQCIDRIFVFTCVVLFAACAVGRALVQVLIFTSLEKKGHSSGVGKLTFMDKILLTKDEIVIDARLKNFRKKINVALLAIYIIAIVHSVLLGFFA